LPAVESIVGAAASPPGSIGITEHGTPARRNPNRG